jgi:hypothetical protein
MNVIKKTQCIPAPSNFANEGDCQVAKHRTGQSACRGLTCTQLHYS